MAARRPDPCALAFEQVLITLGHAPSMANAIASDYKLIVPVLLRNLGAEQIATAMSQAQEEYGLHADIGWYRGDGRACVEWAEHVLRRYREQRSH